MPDKTILVLRHGEKPDDPKDPNLSPAGYDRADALKSFIPDKFGSPAQLYASAISKHSARPYETLEPLSKKTGIPIDSTIADQDYPVLVQELLAIDSKNDSLIVVCWHHGNIPRIAALLGANAGTYPNPWDPTVFDLILKFDLTAHGSPPVVSQHREKFPVVARQS